MKKIIVMPVVLMLLIFTSCFPPPLPPPHGVWVSEEPRIVLYLRPEYQVAGFGDYTYFGIYMISEVERKVLVEFGTGTILRIHDLTEPRGIGTETWTGREGGQTGQGISHSGTVLRGSYRVDGKELRYTLNEPFRELVGIRNISFQYVKDYEPLDPEWLENFVFRPEEE